jgi:uncharacterized Tic20 family protein
LEGLTMNTMTDANDLWWAFASNPLSQRLVIIAFIAVCIGGLILWTLYRLGRRPRRPLWVDSDGTGTIEFALLLPVLLFVVLILAQVTFLMGGNLFVHYASFAGARAAIVQIPQNEPGEPANYIDASAGSTKFDAVRRAVVYALVPVAGEATGGSGLPTSSVVQGLKAWYEAYGDEAPQWIDTRIAKRIDYAALNTEITIERPRIIDEQTVEFEPCSAFEPRDPVTVRVDHRLNLNIPYVRQIFADGGDAQTGRYTNIMARATLSNEGLRDDLPPTPELPRRP